MVMCCSQWMLIIHTNEYARAEEEGDEEDKGESGEADVLALNWIL